MEFGPAATSSGELAIRVALSRLQALVASQRELKAGSRGIPGQRSGRAGSTCQQASRVLDCARGTAGPQARRPGQAPMASDGEPR
eukprot:4317411-Alexandrium_andersonii.AAC.1